MERLASLTRLKILAASVALGEFTLSELAAYSGANLNTIRSVVHRDRELFQRIPVGSETETETSGVGPSPVASTLRSPGRPPTRWRVVDAEHIRQLVTGLQDEVAEARQATAGPRYGAEQSRHTARLAALQVAEEAILQACTEHDPELRRVLCRTAFNSLVDAGPPQLEGVEPAQWWDGTPFDASVAADGAAVADLAETALRRRASAIAELARVIDAEAGGAVIGPNELARAALSASRLDAVPTEPSVQSLFERLSDAALRTRQTVGEANVFGQIVKAKEPVEVSSVVAGTGLPPDAVNGFLQRLIDRKYVVPHYENGGRGQPFAALRVNQDQHRAIGVSILPGKLIGILTDLRGSGTEATVRSREFGVASNERVDVDLVVDAIRSLVEELARGREDIIGLGVELPGHVGRDGEVIYSPILRQSRVQLENMLQQATGLRTVVENDANALAVHEQYFGSGTDIGDFAVILLPERGGVGSGLISDYRVVYGSKGAAGELGHIQYDPAGVRCDCGKDGCLETVAGVSGILREVRRLRKSVDKLTHAAELAAEDKSVLDVFGNAGRALGWGIASVLNLLDPERVILFAPAELVDDRPAATAFTDAVQDTASQQSFTTAAPFKPVLRELPYQPVWRPLPHEGTIAARAASAVLGHFIPRAYDWSPVPSAEARTS